jgi:hypothetical protein
MVKSKCLPGRLRGRHKKLMLKGGNVHAHALHALLAGCLNTGGATNVACVESRTKQAAFIRGSNFDKDAVVPVYRARLCCNSRRVVTSAGSNPGCAGAALGRS